MKNSILLTSMTTTSCSQLKFSIINITSYSLIRCYMFKIGYISDSTYFSVPNVDWNGKKVFKTSIFYLFCKS